MTQVILNCEVDDDGKTKCSALGAIVEADDLKSALMTWADAIETRIIGLNSGSEKTVASGPPKPITTHDAYMAHYTQEWVDPAQELKDRERTRKRMAIDAMRQEVERSQKQIAILKAEIGD